MNDHWKSSVYLSAALFVSLLIYNLIYLNAFSLNGFLGAIAGTGTPVGGGVWWRRDLRHVPLDHAGCSRSASGRQKPAAGAGAENRASARTELCTERLPLIVPVMRRMHGFGIGRVRSEDLFFRRSTSRLGKDRRNRR